MSSLVIDSTSPPTMRNDQLAEINQKLDLLTHSMEALDQRINFLIDEAESGRSRHREIDDFVTDFGPIAKEMYGVASRQLEEMEQFVQLEDLLFLAKRLARNTRNMNEMLDVLESGFDFVKDAAPLTREMMDQATDSLASLERKGYFGFARQGAYVMDRIVTSFSEEDVKRLGDNVVLILNTVKALTQPEMMNMLNSLTQGFHEAKAEADAGMLDTGFIGLARQMRDPDVRRGLAITMATLKNVSLQAPKPAPAQTK